MTAPDLRVEVEQFAADTELLLKACFDDVPDPVIDAHAGRRVVEIKPVTLSANGQKLAELWRTPRSC